MQCFHKCMQYHSLTSTKGPFYKLSKKPLWQNDTREELSILLLNWHSAHAVFRWRPLMNLDSLFLPLTPFNVFFLICSPNRQQLMLKHWTSKPYKRPPFWFIDKTPGEEFSLHLCCSRILQWLLQKLWHLPGYCQSSIWG